MSREHGRGIQRECLRQILVVDPPTADNLKKKKRVEQAVLGGRFPMHVGTYTEQDIAAISCLIAIAAT